VRISCPYKPRSRDPTLIFGPLDICIVNRCPPVGLCLDYNEDRGATEHYTNLDQMGIWSRKCDVASSSLSTVAIYRGSELSLYILASSLSLRLML